MVPARRVPAPAAAGTAGAGRFSTATAPVRGQPLVELPPPQEIARVRAGPLVRVHVNRRESYQHTTTNPTPRARSAATSPRSATTGASSTRRALPTHSQVGRRARLSSATDGSRRQVERRSSGSQCGPVVARESLSAARRVSGRLNSSTRPAAAPVAPPGRVKEGQPAPPSRAAAQRTAPGSAAPPTHPSSRLTGRKVTHRRARRERKHRRQPQRRESLPATGRRACGRGGCANPPRTTTAPSSTGSGSRSRRASPRTARCGTCAPTPPLPDLHRGDPQPPARADRLEMPPQRRAVAQGDGRRDPQRAPTRPPPPFRLAPFHVPRSACGQRGQQRARKSPPARPRISTKPPAPPPPPAPAGRAHPAAASGPPRPRTSAARVEREQRVLLEEMPCQHRLGVRAQRRRRRHDATRACPRRSRPARPAAPPPRPGTPPRACGPRARGLAGSRATPPTRAAASASVSMSGGWW